MNLSFSLAVTGSNPASAGMTGEWCQSLWSVTGSSGRISRALLSCLPSILPLSIIVNQSGGVSTGGDCQSSGVRRGAGCTLASHYAGTGPPGAPLQRPPGQSATAQTQTFCCRLRTAEEHGGVKPPEQLCVDKGAAEDLTANTLPQTRMT